jgi:methanogenic corrinoid protein MtbC1
MPDRGVRIRVIRLIEGGAMTELSGSSPTRTAHGSFAAGLLRAGSRALAAHAAESLLERHPAAGDLFGAKAFRNWQENMGQRIEELAAAVEMQAPGLFAREVGWSLAAFQARGVPVAAVRHSLEALRNGIAQDLPAEVFAFVRPILEAGIEASVADPRPMPRLQGEGPAGELAVSYLEAVLSGRRFEGIDLLVRALDRGSDLTFLYERVLLPVQVEVGTMWHLGEISVPEEHAATEATRSAMAVLSYRARAVQPEPRIGKPAVGPGVGTGVGPGVVLVGAVEGDRHDIGVRAVADLAEIAGWTSIALGADVPSRDIVRACEDFDASTLILSATMSAHLPAVSSAIRAVRASDRGPGLRIIVGGEAFAGDAALAQRAGADALATSASHAVQLIG